MNLVAFATMSRKAAITEKATYVPAIPKDAIVAKLAKKDFFLTDRPAYRMIGGRKNLHGHALGQIHLDLIKAFGFLSQRLRLSSTPNISMLFIKATCS